MASLDSRERITDLVRARFTMAQAASRRAHSKAGDWYDLWRGVRTGRFHTNRNNIHIPYGFSIVQSAVAQKVAADFTEMPYVEFDGFSPDDGPIARKHTLLVNAQLKDDKASSKSYDFYSSAETYGTAVAMLGWRHDVQHRQFPFLDEDEQGNESMQQFEDKNAIVFNSPSFKNLDILDCFPQPGVPRIDDMKWFIYRDYIDFDDIKDLMKQRFYDQSAEKELSESNFPFAEFAARAGYSRGGQFDGSLQDLPDRTVEILEMWGRVPSTHLARGHSPYRVITLANRSVVLRNRPVPYARREFLPFLAYSPFQDQHDFWAPGKMEINETLMLTINRFASQRSDILDLVADPIFAANTDVIDIENLFAGPGNIIDANGDVGDGNLRAIVPDLRGLDRIYPEIETLFRNMQQASGIIDDVVMGGPGGSDRQTAHEFVGRQQQASTRLMIELMLGRTHFVEPLANAFVDLDRQFLDNGHEVRIAGRHAWVDPITEQPIIEVINREDLEHQFDARASKDMLGRAARQQMLFQFTQLISQNPVVGVRLNWENYLRQMFYEFDSFKPDDLLVLSPEQLALNMQAYGMMEGGNGERRESAPSGFFAGQNPISGGGLVDARGALGGQGFAA